MTLHCTVPTHINSEQYPPISTVNSTHPYQQCTVPTHINSVQYPPISTVYSTHPYQQCRSFYLLRWSFSPLIHKHATIIINGWSQVFPGAERVLERLNVIISETFIKKHTLRNTMSQLLYNYKEDTVCTGILTFLYISSNAT